MLTFEARPTLIKGDRVFGHAVCDRCGHAADEAHIHSGYRLFGLLRFRAGSESAFGEGHYVEGDLCDACLFTLLGRYGRATDTDLHRRIETSGGHTEAPRRLFVSEGLLDTLSSVKSVTRS